ncbi:MAG: lysophospholipid acyltransferase family protein, partial [Pseudomonadota bacterium]
MRITPMGWVLVLMRGLPLLCAILIGVTVIAALRLVERPLHGASRPWTPWITVVFSRIVLALLRVRHQVKGHMMAHPGALVANHSSWLDIFTLNAVSPMYFVSKAEVAGWPGIGFLARITGTVFIARDRAQARAQKDIFEDRLHAGHRLLFFPEGTSTDNFRVLPFKSTLFEAFFTEDLRETLYIQPVTVAYTAPPGQDPRFYGWWGDMDFGPHALMLLAQPKGGSVDVVFHPPVPVRSIANRKVMAAAMEKAVRQGMPEGRQVAH